MDLKRLISERNKNKNLSLYLPSFLYALSKYGELSLPPKKRVLYVGVGHGLDMLTCSGLNASTEYVGVDPYIMTDGNDENDYASLKINAPANVALFRMTIQEYLSEHIGNTKFDLIIISDCLHHIFVTSDYLPQSPLAPNIVKLFQDLAQVGTSETEILICEASRYNLSRVLQIFKKNKSIDYRTKHDYKSWSRLLVESGWRVKQITPYVPVAASALDIKSLKRLWMSLSHSYYIRASL